MGKLKYIYDTFGDGVNTASRMQGHSDPMQVNISASTRTILSDAFILESRGLTDVKGKGPMEMFYVHGGPKLEPTEAQTPSPPQLLGITNIFASPGYVAPSE